MTHLKIFRPKYALSYFLPVTILLIFITNSLQGQGWSSFNCNTISSPGVTKLASDGNNLDYGAPFVSPLIYSQSGSQFPYGCFNNTNYFPFVDLRGMEYYNNNLYVTGVNQNSDSSRIYFSGGNIGSVDGWVNCLQNFNGHLYAGGGFSQINGLAAGNIAKWNGSVWSTVGSGLISTPGGFIKTMGIHNNQLFAAIPIAFSNNTDIYYFNGVNWNLAGTISNPNGANVISMKSYNGSLYIGGTFNSAGGVPVSNIARWNGTTWSSVGTGITDVNGAFVICLEVYNSILYAGGIFSNAGGVSVSNIAAWNGTTWSSPGSGMNNSVNSLLNYKGSLIAGGSFTTVNGQSMNYIARYTACPYSLSVSGSLSFCNGSVTLSAPAGTSYQWKKNGINIIGATASTYVASTTGNYFCILTGTCGSIYTNSLYVNAAAPPTATITASGATTFCAGGSVTLSANTGTGLTYQWRTNGVNISGATSSTYIASISGTYNCYISNSCSGTTSNNISVINNTSNAFINPTGNISICTGTTQFLTTNTSGGLTYQWKLNGVSISGATLPYYYAGTAGSYTVQLTQSGCIATSPATVLSIVNLPVIPGSISTTGGTAKVCPGTTKSYYIASLPGATSYNWIAPPGGTITNGQGTTNVTIYYTPNFTVTDTLKVAAINSCGTGPYRTLKITRNNPSTPSVISGLLFGVCNLSNVSHSVTNVAGMTYNWYFGSAGATIATGQGTNSITSNFSGYVSGTINVTASNACGTSGIRSTTVRATPAKPVSLTGPISVCANQQNVSYSIAANPYSTGYTWVGPTGSHISDGVITSVSNTLNTTATAVTVDYSVTAGYLKVRANNSCGSGSYLNTLITMPCRIQEEFIPENFIYPNPVVTQFTVSYPEDVEINIWDVTGRLIMNANLLKGEYLNISTFTKGIYICEVKNAGKLIYKGKIVKE